jgi:hypothetical protein
MPKANYCLMRFTRLYEFYEKKYRTTKNGKTSYHIYPAVESVFNEMYRGTKTVYEDGVYDYNYRYGYSWNMAKNAIDDARDGHNKNIAITHNSRVPVRKMRRGVSQCFAVDFSFSPEMKGEIDLLEWQRLNNEFIEETFCVYGCKVLSKNFKVGDIVTMRYVILSWNESTQRSASRDFLKDRDHILRCYEHYCEKMKPLGLQRAQKSI